MEKIVSEELWFEVACQMCDVLLSLFGYEWVISWIALSFSEEERKMIIFGKLPF